ncbi:ATP-dependent helicase [Candidatus Saccharibacteria bacterium]|nr:ATP-dependent helicase [Candidatus Saccharibacteria bacterium]
MELNELQKEAVEYLEGPLLVIAGPGTGKTQLLSKKVEYILQNTDANPENILCLTFTESGAQNMRDRLQTTIGRAANQVQIHTYHAFGADILAEYRKYATEFTRKLDSPIDEIAQYKIVKEIQDGLSGNDILRGDRISDIIETIGSAKSARLTPDDLERIARDNMAVSEQMSEEFAAILDAAAGKALRFPAAVEQVYRPICEVLMQYVSDEPLAPGVYKEANAYLYELNQIIKEESEKEKPSAKPLSKWRDARFDKDADGNYRLKNVVANKKLLSFAAIMRKYDERLVVEETFDFSDMIEEAIRILKEDRGFRLTLSERYQYILLDEFQDTNPSQAELIYLLTDYEKPIVMAVGDDDQAICEFQGANASNFIEYQNHYDAKIITLKNNYRSAAEILELSRKVADQIDSSFARKRGLDKNLKACRKFDRCEIARHEFLSSDGEYYFIAEQIAELVRSGVPQKEIAVIAPKHKYIVPLLPYLKAHEGIYVAYEKRDNILADRQITELVTMAKFIQGVADGESVSHLVLPILSFPCFEISPLAAIKASRRDVKKSGLDYFSEAEDEKIRALGEFLATLILKSSEAPLELMIDYMIGTVEVSEGVKSPFLDYYSKADEYAEFALYEKLNVLRAALDSHLKGVERPSLKDFLQLVLDYESAGKGLLNTSPYSEAEDAVQILTAHKAKGLEFSHVFLIAMDNLAWGKGKGNNNLLVLPANLIQIRHTGTTDDERLRLLFVAITRAKTNLYLTSSLTDFAGKMPKRLEYLDEHEEGEVLVSPYIGKIRTHYEDLEAAKRKTDLRLSWVSAYRELTPELRPILLKRLENYHLTASDLTSFIDICYAGPTEFYKSRVLQAPREPLEGALLFGTVVHTVFEQVTKSKISDAEALEMFRSEVLKQPVSAADQKYMLERGASAVEKSLQEFGSILRADGGFAEISFFSEHLAMDGVPLTGVIDHINVDQKNKTIELYDFKTSKYYKESWDSIDALYKYKLQLGIYKMLLNLSPTYAGYKVLRGHILFVSPDGYAEVHDKVYEFNEKDEQELLALARSVYHEIRTLDFVSDSELFVEPDQSKGLADIKKFVRVLIDKNSKK